MELKVSKRYKQLYKPYRYKVLYGGRGSGKSWEIARALLILGTISKKRILCTREIQNSIAASVHMLLNEQIQELGFGYFYKVQKDKITGINGTEFSFAGLYRNVAKIKSMEGIDIAWVEEAHSVSNESWDLLIPTIRKEGSEIWLSYNRDTEEDPCHMRFVENPRTGSFILKVNYTENKHFPEVLQKEMEYDKRTNYDKYLHIWEGFPLKHADAQVFKGKWRIEDFETPGGVDFYYGADWGFSVDPSTLIRFFISENRLYIDYEFYEVGVEIDQLPGRFARIPGASRNEIRADSARPETISYMRRHGFPLMTKSKKGKGSIEDGIEWIKSFDEVIIHTRCPHTADEFKNYKYKVKKLTGEITREPEDKKNHTIDAIRYGGELLRKMARFSGVSAASLGL